MKKSVLGKGILEIIGNEPSTKDAVVEIDIALIKPNPFQPRKSFSPESIQQLAESIAESGLIQPVIVYKKDDFYHLVVGERRWRAVQFLKWEKIPAIVRHFDDNELAIGALIENLQREDLNAIEISDSLQAIIKRTSWTQDFLAKKLGKSRPAISNLLRLQSLPEEVKKMIAENKLDQGHARSLLSLEDPQKIIRFAQMIVSRNLSVREVERLVNQEKRRDKKVQMQADADLNKLLEKISAFYKAKASLKINKKYHGTISLTFSSQEELSRLIELLLRS